MGSVFEAEHEDLHKRVAIKTMRGPDADQPERRERFLREGRAASRVRHPHAIDVYDVGLEGDTAYLVMELLEGEDFEAVLSREGSLKVEAALEIMLPVLAAVSAAHEAGVVHRDLKPANVFIARTPEGPHPKVVDFGISKLEGDEGMALTASAAILGTPYYLAPEQLKGARFTDARSDQWALCVILYECLAGRRPFEADSLMTLLWNIGHGEPRPVRDHRPEVPPALDDAVLKGLSRDPQQRHDSVRALGASILPFASIEVRIRWSRTFAEPPRAGRASAPEGDVGLAATLPPASSPSAEHGAVDRRGESARDLHVVGTRRSVSSAPRPRARPAVIVIGAMSVALLVGGLFWDLRARTTPVSARTSAAATPGASAPTRAVVVEPATAPPRSPSPPVATNVAPAGAPAIDAAPTPEPVRRGRRHRTRRGHNDAAAPHAATTMVNGAPVLPVLTQ